MTKEIIILLCNHQIKSYQSFIHELNYLLFIKNKNVSTIKDALP